MSNIFSLDLGSLFGGKDDKTTLDKNTLQAVSQATVHTMKNDLAGDISELSNSSIDLKSKSESSEKAAPQKIIPPQIERKEINNPFAEKKNPFQNLNQPQREIERKSQPLPASPQVKSPIEIQTITLNKPAPTPIQKTIKETPPVTANPQKETGNKPSKFNIGKALTFFFSFVLVILLAGGGYYLWINQQKPVAPVEITNTPIPTSIPSNPITTDPQKPLPKYLNVDFQNSTAIQVIETIKKYLGETTFSSDGAPVEFVISDLQNNPISFIDFSSKLGLSLPAEIQTNLSEPFRFFASSYNENIGIGIITTSKNDSALKAILLSEEKNLIAYFKPLLFTKQFGVLDKKVITFNDNNYKDIDVRYYNILSQDELSFDYTVFENKFIFGTTMMTLRSIFNYLEEEKINLPQDSTTKNMPDLNSDALLP